MKIMRALTDIKVATSVQQSKPVTQFLEEKETNYIAAHHTMMATLKHWLVDKPQSHDTRPKIFTTTLDPAVRAFNADPTNQKKFQTMVDALLAINTSVLPENQSTRDFQILHDIIINAAAKEHAYLQTTELTTKPKDASPATMLSSNNARPAISFAPFFKAALKQASSIEESTVKDSVSKKLPRGW